MLRHWTAGNSLGAVTTKHCIQFYDQLFDKYLNYHCALHSTTKIRYLMFFHSLEKEYMTFLSNREDHQVSYCIYHL